MIVDIWYDMDSLGWNGRARDDHTVNASAIDQLGGQWAMRGYIVDAWNREHPDDPKTIKDFVWEMTDERW